MKLIVDNLLINYQDHGTGKVILFLHGWTEAAQQSFQQLSQVFAKDYRVLLPDLPGFGQSTMPPENWGVPEYGMFVQKFLEKLEVKPDIIIAHSNGGTIALYAVGNRLIAPQKLVLLGSAGIREKAKLKKNLLRVAAKPVKAALLPFPHLFQERLKKRIYGKLGSDLYVMENMKPIFNRVVSYDIQAEAKKVTQPTLLIYGSDDSSTPVSFGELFAGVMPSARLEVVPRAGHYVHLDQLQKVLELIEDFLA